MTHSNPTLHSELAALVEWCMDRASAFALMSVRRRIYSEVAVKINALSRQYPETREAACVHGCGECHPDPGPWHQRGCPSWRATGPGESREAERRDCPKCGGKMEPAYCDKCDAVLTPKQDEALKQYFYTQDAEKQRRAFVDGAKWMYREECGWKQAITEASFRYPDAKEGT